MTPKQLHEHSYCVCDESLALAKKRVFIVNFRCRKTRQSVDGVTLCSRPQESFSLFSLFCLFFISDTCSTLTDIFHLSGYRLGSTEGQIKQQLQNSSFFDLQTAHGAFVLGKKKKICGSALSVFCLIAYAFAGVSGLECKIQDGNAPSVHAT